jgi:hypothetical protein
MASSRNLYLKLSTFLHFIHTLSTQPCRFHEGAQRPLTLMNVTSKDIWAHSVPAPSTDMPSQPMSKGVAANDVSEVRAEADMLQMLRETVLAEQPLSVVAANNPKHPRRHFRFNARTCIDAASKSRLLVVTEHCDGAKFCEALFGHFLLPNGRLAHFYYQVWLPMHAIADCIFCVFVVPGQDLLAKVTAPRNCDHRALL